MGQSCTQSSNGAGWAGEALLAAAFGAAGTAPDLDFSSVQPRGILLTFLASVAPGCSLSSSQLCGGDSGLFCWERRDRRSFNISSPRRRWGGPRERGPESSTFFPNPYLENKEKVGGLRAAGAPGSG